MSTNADWSDLPAGQVFVDDENAKKATSSGLSDAIDGIDIEIGDEDDLLGSPTASVRSDSTVEVIVPVKCGLLPTGLPLTMQVLDERSRVPMITETAHTSNDSKNSGMTSNDLKSSSLTSNDLSNQGASLPVPTTTPQVHLTRNKPRALARPAAIPPSNPLNLIGNLDDYALSVPIVNNWKYVPNPPGVLRMPFRGLESHVRSRLTPDARTKLQMSAHRNGSI